ncbi:abortive infection bacteriophage resistance protein [Geothermobacter ehrlichii]|uniref:Abortive infection bacteriophage resistance protein n=1 Tax=Geothermobacter ehrlichii TaxID=213224 RepID=A0A5D3WJT0_9BACT|nr:Abi family protein [Geothermobacter ehrlichii]TYO98561.1 abortive infection bacteriophage resistance protein [Geothermobacter ehrlichii]
MNQFNKAPLTIDEQLELWQSRGLNVPDPERARRYLSVISYYRLSAYSRPFQSADHRFKPGVTFDDVLGLYVFDRKLRLFILDAIERIEVAFRARMTQVLGENYGAHAYTLPAIFGNKYGHDWLLDNVREKCNGRNAEPFLQHYRQKYRDPELPPVWMVMEVLTFKEVSYLFAHLRHKKDKQAVADFWGLPVPIAESWFRALSDLRNVCAHHARTWNREFGSRPRIPRKPPANWPNLSPLPRTGIDPTKRLYHLLVVIEYMLRRINPGSSWHQRLFELMEQHPHVSREHMGMPENWYKEKFWNL